MILRRSLLAAGCLGALVGTSLANPAITTASSAMRKAASRYSAVVQAVPANAQVDIQSCGAEWCYGSWRGLYGFLPSFAVVQDAPPLPPPPAPPPVVFAPPPPPLVVTAPVVVAPPAYSWGGPYVGLGWGYGWRRW